MNVLVFAVELFCSRGGPRRAFGRRLLFPAGAVAGTALVRGFARLFHASVPHLCRTFWRCLCLAASSSRCSGRGECLARMPRRQSLRRWCRFWRKGLSGQVCADARGIGGCRWTDCAGCFCRRFRSRLKRFSRCRCFWSAGLRWPATCWRCGRKRKTPLIIQHTLAGICRWCWYRLLPHKLKAKARFGLFAQRADGVVCACALVRPHALNAFAPLLDRGQSQLIRSLVWRGRSLCSARAPYRLYRYDIRPLC